MQLTPKDEPVAERDHHAEYQEWARAKYKEVVTQINPCDESGRLDPIRLNHILTTFGGNFAWAITMLEVESNQMNLLNYQFERWSKQRYMDAFKVLKEESLGARAPGQTTIEAKVVEIAGEELEQRQNELQNQKSRVDLLKRLVEVMRTQAGMLQTLSSNMRSEVFFAGGVTMGGGDQRGAQQVLKTVMKAHNQSEPTGTD